MSDTDGERFRNLVALLVLFGERYIHVDDVQALHDCQYGRENMVAAFAAILSMAGDEQKLCQE